MILVGKVVSHQMQNTVVVAVTRRVAHPRYGKRLRRTTKYYAHTTTPLAVGDRVQLVQIRPMSKTKFFQVVKVV